jgi:hypothetical protein
MKNFDSNFIKLILLIIIKYDDDKVSNITWNTGIDSLPELKQQTLMNFLTHLFFNIKNKIYNIENTNENMGEEILFLINNKLIKLNPSETGREIYLTNKGEKYINKLINYNNYNINNEISKSLLLTDKNKKPFFDNFIYFIKKNNQLIFSRKETSSKPGSL